MNMATSSKPWTSREEYKKAKELDEARKAGTAPPEQDEEGRDINPHIPLYIKQAPWYLNTGKPGLKHQRKNNFKEDKESEFDNIDNWYARGTFKEASTKFRKGACTNCGAMTHQVKDCMDRPRKIGAKWNGEDIKPDEVIVDVNLDFEGKRDRWNGFDPRMYKQVMDEYQEAEAARRKVLAEERSKKFMTEPDATHKRYPHGTDDKPERPQTESLVDDEDIEEDFDSADIALDSDRFTKRDPRTRTTVRNLRIREDLVKYLHNLDPESASYDPKSRSMRDNPFEGKNPDEVSFAGDNYIKTGDSENFFEMQRFAWEACHETAEVPNIFAEPSHAEILFEEQKRRKQELENETKAKLTAQYGGEEYTKAPPKILLTGQSEHYQEYAPDGTLLTEIENIPKSKYEEDVYTNSHTSVWGSWYDVKTGKWGFQCCKQTDKESTCGSGSEKKEDTENMVEKLKEAVKESEENPIVENEVIPEVTTELKEEVPQISVENKKNKESESESKESESSSESEKKSKKDKKKKKEKDKKRKERKEKKRRKTKKKLDELYKDEGKMENPKSKKQKYNSFDADNVSITNEELQNYHHQKKRWEDPMANM